MVLLMVMARRRDVMGTFMVTGTLYWLATAVMAVGVVAMAIALVL